MSSFSTTSTARKVRAIGADEMLRRVRGTVRLALPGRPDDWDDAASDAILRILDRVPLSARPVDLDRRPPLRSGQTRADLLRWLDRNLDATDHLSRAMPAWVPAGLLNTAEVYGMATNYGRSLDRRRKAEEEARANNAGTTDGGFQARETVEAQLVQDAPAYIARRRAVEMMRTAGVLAPAGESPSGPVWTLFYCAARATVTATPGAGWALNTDAAGDELELSGETVRQHLSRARKRIGAHLPRVAWRECFYLPTDDAGTSRKASASRNHSADLNDTGWLDSQRAAVKAGRMSDAIEERSAQGGRRKAPAILPAAIPAAQPVPGVAAHWRDTLSTARAASLAGAAHRTRVRTLSRTTAERRSIRLAAGVKRPVR